MRICILLLLSALTCVTTVDARCLRCRKVRRPITSRPVVVRDDKVSVSVAESEADIQTILAR